MLGLLSTWEGRSPDLCAVLVATIRRAALLLDGFQSFFSENKAFIVVDCIQTVSMPHKNASVSFDVINGLDVPMGAICDAILIGSPNFGSALFNDPRRRNPDWFES